MLIHWSVARSISLSRYPASESHKPATMSRITNSSPSKTYVSRYHDQSYTPQSSARPISPQSLGERSTLHHTQWTSAPSPTNDVSAPVNSGLYQTNSVFTAPMVPVPGKLYDISMWTIKILIGDHSRALFHTRVYAVSYSSGGALTWTFVAGQQLYNAQ